MKKIFTILIVGVTLIACAREVLPEPEEELLGAKTYTMTVEANKGADDITKALTLAGSDINFTWTEGDAVTVYNVSRSEVLGGTLTAQSAGASTTLKGTLNGTIGNGDKLQLKFQSPSYASQTGTLEYIAANCDYAVATVSVTDASTPSITTTAASFTNQQAIVKFTLKEKVDGDPAINAGVLTVSDGVHTYTITPASPTNTLYVAIPGFASSTVTLAAAVGSDLYTYERSGVTFANSQYYQINVRMSKNNVYNFPYTGDVQTFIVPVPGTYTLEVWGAQGGNRTHTNDTHGYGGRGGYATCRTTLAAGETIYVYVGGQGVSVPNDNNWNDGAGGAGGWNGGGAGGHGAGGHSGSCGGGGATHISKVNNQVIGSGNGQCASLVGTNFIIVAGGGGGSGHPSTNAGDGGGVSGERGKKYATPDNVTYSDYYYYDLNKSYGAVGGTGLMVSTSAEGAGGGGGGYYGGAAYMSGSTFTVEFQDAGGCGGSSAYNSSLATSFSTTAGQQWGNGQARITFYAQ